jgi:hypothetical protein
MVTDKYLIAAIVVAQQWEVQGVRFLGRKREDERR